MNIRRDTRIAKCSKEDGVKLTRQHGEPVRRHRRLIREIAIRSPVKRCEFHCRARGLNDLHRLRDDFLTDSVAGDDGNYSLFTHAKRR